MARYVAFLRGMNLGRRRIKNPELCRCFEALGFDDVSAFLASGNVLFASKATPRQVERTLSRGLEERLSYPVPTFVRTAREIAAIAAHEPFSAATLARSAGKLQVALLSRGPEGKARKAVLALASDDDALAIVGRELYWLPAGNMSDSELPMAQIERAVGTLTIRTHRTVRRLADKLA